MLDFLFRQFLELKAEGDVVKHVQMREKRVLLEHGVDAALMRRQVVDLFALKIYLALLRRLKARDDPQGRCFAAAGGAEQGNKLFVINVEVDVVQYDLVRIPEIDIFQRYDGFFQLSDLLSSQPKGAAPLIKPFKRLFRAKGYRNPPREMHSRLNYKGHKVVCQ